MQQAILGVWSDFQDLPKSTMFETMGYSPGFLLINGQYPTLANSPEIDTNGRARGQKSIQKGLGGFSESLERFPGLAKIRHVQNHGLQPRLFAQKRSISDPWEFTPNRYKWSLKGLKIYLEGFRRRFREFGAISWTCQNPPCSKPWAIAQAFCSKTANIRPSRIHPKSTQTVPQGVRNPFPSMQQAILGVWSDFQNLSKSTMFETIGYSPDFLLKNGQFPTLANSPEIDTNSPLRSQKSIQKGLGGFSESLERFPELTKSAMFKTMGYSPGFLLKNGQFPTLANSPEIDTNGRPKGQKSIQKGLGCFSESLERFPELTKIRHIENHGQQPRLFAQKRPISDPREFARNRHKHSRNQLEIHFQVCSRRFREFGAIPRTYQNPPC